MTTSYVAYYRVSTKSQGESGLGLDGQRAIVCHFADCDELASEFTETASAKDIEDMAAIVKEGIVAGALGFSMSRTIVHRAIDGEVVPGTHAAEDEIFGIARVLGELDRGIVELAPAGVQGEVRRLRGEGRWPAKPAKGRFASWGDSIAPLRVPGTDRRGSGP